MKSPNSNKIVTVVTYNDASVEMKSILRDNKGKSGVYLWTNKVNGKKYVGSSVNLSRRFKSYYNVNYLKSSSAKTMLINRALLKYGYSNFKLEILEYCEACDLLAREQHFIITILPEYNILQTAGSSLGFKHSEETKQKISDALIGSKLSNETKKKNLWCSDRREKFYVWKNS